MKPSLLRPLAATVAAAILVNFLTPSAHAEKEGAAADALARKITTAFNAKKDLPPPPIPFAGTKNFNPEKRLADDPIIGLWSFRTCIANSYCPMAILPNGTIGGIDDARNGGILWYPTPKPGFYAFRFCEDNSERNYALVYLDKKEQKLIYIVGSESTGSGDEYEAGETAATIEGFVALIEAGIPVATVAKHMNTLEERSIIAQYSAKRVTPPLALQTKNAPAKEEKTAPACEPALPDFLKGIWEGKYKIENYETPIHIRMILANDTEDFLLRWSPVEKGAIERKKSCVSLKPSVMPNLFLLSGDASDIRYFVYFEKDSDKKNALLLSERDFYGREYLSERTIAKFFGMGYSLDEICAHLNLQKIPVAKILPAPRATKTK